MGPILVQEQLPQHWLCCAGPRASGWHWGQLCWAWPSSCTGGSSDRAVGCWSGWAGLTLVLVGPVLPGLVGLCNAGVGGPG